MPPRLRLRAPVKLAPQSESRYLCRCSYATVTATTPAPSSEDLLAASPPLMRYHPSQPLSHKPPAARRTQLLREYVSLLQSTPLFLLFQHNNLKASEWVGIRRELNAALKKLDEAQLAEGRPENAIGSGIKLEIVRTNIFEPALRVSEYYRPPPAPSTPHSTNAAEQKSGRGSISATSDPVDRAFTHALSRNAYMEASKHKKQHPLTPLLAGPVALLTFPSVSPQYIKTTLQILAPQAPTFPAPTRRANPGYWDTPVQDGLKKLLLLGARVEGKVFDLEGTKWVGTIDGGIDGLRAQLVQMLQSFGAGITGALESASRNLYFTMEGRKNMLEDEDKPKEGDQKSSEQ